MLLLVSVLLQVYYKDNKLLNVEVEKATGLAAADHSASSDP